MNSQSSSNIVSGCVKWSETDSLNQKFWDLSTQNEFFDATKPPVGHSMSVETILFLYRRLDKDMIARGACKSHHGQILRTVLHAKDKIFIFIQVLICKSSFNHESSTTHVEFKRHVCFPWNQLVRKMGRWRPKKGTAFRHILRYIYVSRLSFNLYAGWQVTGTHHNCVLISTRSSI